jgi:hypothetical protein
MKKMLLELSAGEPPISCSIVILVSPWTAAKQFSRANEILS